jgi:Sec-independent protein translocase protein TatA
MDNWVIIVIVGIVCVIGIPVGLPMLIGLVAVVLDHRKAMADVKAKKKVAGVDQEKLSTDYQEFVLGVDARLQKIEERLRLVESRQRQSGESGESQQIRRGQ